MYAVCRKECHQRDDTFLFRSVGLGISCFRVVLPRCDWRLSITLVDSVHSVRSSEGEHGGESGPYTAGIVHNSLTVAIYSSTRAEGFVDGFGSADAGNQCEGLYRETRIQSHDLVAVGRDDSFLFADRVSCLGARTDIATTDRFVVGF
jgi:hypothetical protein